MHSIRRDAPPDFGSGLRTVGWVPSCRLRQRLPRWTRQAVRVPDAELDEIISGRRVCTEIAATGEYQVVAVDVFGSWAAVFRFAMLKSGDVDTEAEIAGLRSDGSWDFYVGGGMGSAGWGVPWRRPAEGWGQDHLITFGVCGNDVEVDGEDVEIIAVPGFASAATDAVRVTTAAADRTITPYTTGAFVAVGLGRGFDYMKLTPMKDGLPLSPERSFPRRP
jgi:hypothetical protein